MTTRDRADEERVQAKQEQNEGNARSAAAAAAVTANIAAGSSWSRLKDPRIVRVSRAFGGKDRHSKVCTVRGLRDRRVRLSVPTAIQLYDLQDRLGLNQPSKVVDWLLNVAKNEIDELPPLPSIPSLENLGQINPSGSNNNSWPDGIYRPKQAPSKEAVESSSEKENAYFSSNNFFSRLDHSSSSSSSSQLGLMMNNSYSSLMRWDPSHLSLSQSGMAAEADHHDHFPNFSLVPMPSSLPAGSLHAFGGGGSHHVTQPYFPAAEYSGGRQFHLTKLHDHHQEKQDGDHQNGFDLR